MPESPAAQPLNRPTPPPARPPTEVRFARQKFITTVAAMPVLLVPAKVSVGTEVCGVPKSVTTRPVSVPAPVKLWYALRYGIL